MNRPALPVPTSPSGPNLLESEREPAPPQTLDGDEALASLRYRERIANEAEVLEQLEALRRSGEMLAWRIWMPFNEL